MEKRSSIVRGCLATFGFGLALLAFASFWTLAGMWTSWVDGVLMLATFAMSLGVSRWRKPHVLVSSLVGIGAALLVLSVLLLTHYQLPFFGFSHLLAAGGYGALTYAIAKGLPLDPAHPFTEGLLLRVVPNGRSPFLSQTGVADGELRDRICEALVEDPALGISELVVGVHNGTVTVEGIVEYELARRRTTSRIEEFPGVHEVENRLRVGARRA